MLNPNATVPIENLNVLPHLRVTQIDALCMERMRAEMLGEGTDRTSKAAEKGTLVHLGIEDFLRGHTVVRKEVYENLSNEENTALRIYKEALEPLRPYLKDFECEFKLRLRDGALPVVGHIDAIFDTGDHILVVDHKTNRQYEPEEVWKQRAQPLFYTLAAMLMYPGRDIYFRIGYVFLGRDVTWKASENFPMDLVYEKFDRLWNAFKVYRNESHFPATINIYCSNCCVLDKCNTLQQAHTDFVGSLLQIEEKTIAEKYLFANNVRKAIEVKEEELKQQLMQDIRASGEIVAEDTRFSIRTRTKREISFDAFNNALTATCEELPAEVRDALWDYYSNNASDIMSVKVGEVDKLLQNYPVLEPEVAKVMVTESYEQLHTARVR